MTYKEFLETKIELATERGFVVDPEKVNKVLKPHQRDAVVWALKGGRRALFENFGLGKTVQEIEFCHLAAEHSSGRALIVLPLGVKQEFTHDAVEVLGYEKPEYCRTMEEVEQSKSKIVLTNYERVRDGDIWPDYLQRRLSMKPVFYEVSEARRTRHFWINLRMCLTNWWQLLHHPRTNTKN